MPFPSVPRVRYKNSPLIEVVCQVRFPNILSINENLPALFQEEIREEFPLFEVEIEHQQAFEVDVSAPEITPMPRIVQSEMAKNYAFMSADSKWKVNLTNTFLAVSTRSYTCWEEFVKKIQKPLAALVTIYRPAFFERIGLRYIDAIKRSTIGLANVEWAELIQPFAAGFLSNPLISNDVLSQNSTIEINLMNGGRARINTALGYIDNLSAISESNPEICFIIDSDMFAVHKKLDELPDVFEQLHGDSLKLLRAVITDILHKAMEPEII